MAGLADTLGPTYISSRSADVILSDIRPIKLNLEALRSINVLLDEFLYSVLNAARSLNTHQLKSGLCKVLPTTLGKEALLEAEMELRAYLERTATSGSSLAAEEQGKEFHLQWSFELLRLKCQAYSTLSDSDEDAQTEASLTERMSQTTSGVSPPKVTLVAPAALYLTAILECVCEHVLSNVGRVATRDSSRTTATVQDLFVALCEDDSIYGLFKSMKVYEKIEGLSKIPKPRRSKSFSRPSDSPAHTPSRTSSAQQRADSHPPSALPPSALIHTSSLPLRSRLSSESSGSVATIMLASSNGPVSRSSFDKSRAMKMFTNNRSSGDQTANGSQNESQRTHTKSDSVLSEGMKQTVAAYNLGDQSPTDDQEFDDMMRSGGTMKVSLTPDRLKSMEVYNKEKGQRGNRKLVHKTDSRGSLKSSKAIPPTPELPRNNWQVSGSAIENEENPGNKVSAPRARQTSLSNSTPPVTTAAARLRSISTSGPQGEKPSLTMKKLSKPPAPSSAPPTTYQSRERNIPVQQPNPTTGSPARTRTVARNRESLDLDDVMGTSDDDAAPDEVVVKTPVQRHTKYPVSAGARELIDFLAEGPPDMPDEAAGKRSSISPDTPKKGGRLQRMISKLTLKDAEQKQSYNGGADSYSKSTGRIPSNAGLGMQPPMSPLYNKPVPPRPPPLPTSPPSSPSQSSTSLAEPSPPSPQVHRASNARKSVPSSWDPGSVTPDSPRTPVSGAKGVQDLPTAHVVPPPPKPPSVNGQAKGGHAKEDEKPRGSTTRVSKSMSGVNGSGTKTLLSPPERRSSKMSDAARKSSDSNQSAAMAAFSEHTQDMRRLLAQANNVDECRLIVDMFLAKSGLPPGAVDQSKPSTPSDASNSQPLPSGVDADLEHSLVELFLGSMEEENEGDGDAQPLSSAASKESSVIALPMSPPDTPHPSHSNGSQTTDPTVVKDTQAATPVVAT